VILRELEGEILKVDPPRQLTTTFKPVWAPQTNSTASSTVSWRIASGEEGCKLTLTHEGLDPNSPITEEIHNAWMPTLLNLKSVLESN
jgi:hypothetical protein